MSSDSLDDNKNLPPWLRDVPLPPRPRDTQEPPRPAASAQPGAPATPPPAGQGLPDWLRVSDAGPTTAAPAPETPDRMSGKPEVPPSAQADEQSGLPPWLRDTAPTPQPASGSEQLPTWLKDLTGDETSAPEPTAARAEAPVTPPQQEDHLPSWLRDTQRGAQPPAGAEQPPSWLASADESPPAAQPGAGAGETPAWLRDMAAESPPREQATPPDWLGARESGGQQGTSAAEALPDWLRTRADAVPPAESASTAIPDWLGSRDDVAQPPSAGGQEFDLRGSDKPTAQPPPSIPGPQQAPIDVQGADLDVPAWLRDISADQGDEDITAEPFSFEGATGAQPSAGPAGPPSWLTGDEDTAEAVPDWLREAVGQSEELASAAPEAPDVPLWLQDRDTRPAAPAEATTPEPTIREQPLTLPPSAQDALPAWLQSAAAAEPPSEDVPAWLQSAAAAEPPSEEDVPAWLRDAQPQTPPAEDVPAWLQSAAAAEPPSEAIPDWLHPAAPAEAPLSAPSAQAQEDTLPGIAQPTRAAGPPEPAAARPSEGDELPDWLRPSGPAAEPEAAHGQDLPPWLRDETGQPLPTAGIAGDTSLPAWLRGAPIDTPPAAPAAQTAPPSFDWLEEKTPAASQRAPAAESEFFGGTELPAWLRPPEPEPPKEMNQADARSLDWLTRLGGVEEVETAAPAAAATTPKLAPPLAPTRTPAQLQALALLERLAAQPFPEAAPLPEAAPPSVLRRVGIERALYLALLIALLIGLAVPLPESFGLGVPPATPGADDLFAQIDKLSEQDIVLVGYEWDARRSGELRPLEQAVLEHLIQRKVKLVLVSTDPQGTLLLFDFRDQLAAAGYNKNNPGENYILLGYRPGAELALRLLAQDFRGALKSDFQDSDATERGTLATDAATGEPRLNTLDDLAMILVLADEPQDVQGWMEQVRRPATQVPFAFLLPAETAPLVQPYLSQQGIYHLAGKQGALAYQHLRGDSGVPAEQVALEASQQRLSLLVFIALFLVGAVAVGASGAAGRGRRA